MSDETTIFLGDDRFLEDAEGAKLPLSKVLDLAHGNVMASMSQAELANAFLQELEDDELVEWATDEEGKFPE